MNYLSIDYGDKYIGLAIAVGPLAEPFMTVKKDQAFKTISQVIAQHAIDVIVIGLSEGQMAQKTKAFGTEIKTTFNLPVVYHDETLTSQETRQQMAKIGMKRSRRHGKLDHLVAAAILQDYLDSHF